MVKTKVILSPQNPLIKEVVRLRNRKERDTRKLFIVEGYRELSLALQSPFALRKLFFCAELLEKEQMRLVEEAEKKGAGIFAVSQSVFAKICYGKPREGILGLAEERHIRLDSLSLPKNPLIVAVESLEKPGNLGAILRSGDAAGVSAVIVCDGKTDIYNPNCIRASLGAFFNVVVVEETSSNTLNWLKKNNFNIFLATPQAHQDYTQVDFSGASAIVLGSEDKGLSSAWRKNSNLEINIPMAGKVDSLNVAMAATILIFEALRQRRKAN